MWKVIYYETATGKCPVERFINARSVRKQAKLSVFLALLEEKGPECLQQYISPLKAGISLLRIPLGEKRNRIFYFFCDRGNLVLTHGFAKIVTKDPRVELKKAQTYRENFLQVCRGQHNHKRKYRRTFRHHLEGKLRNSEFRGFYEKYLHRVREGERL